MGQGQVQSGRETMPDNVRFKLTHEKSKIDYASQTPQVVDLSKAINALPGLITTLGTWDKDSPMRIWFQLDGTPISWYNENACMQGLFFMTRSVDKRYWEHGDKWAIQLSVSDIYAFRELYPTNFLLESTATGEEAYTQAKSLIDNMTYHLNHNNFKKEFAIDLSNFKVSENNGSYMFNV